MKLLKISLLVGTVAIGTLPVHAMEPVKEYVFCPEGGNNIHFKQDKRDNTKWQVKAKEGGTVFRGSLPILTGVDPRPSAAGYPQAVEIKQDAYVLSCTYQLENVTYRNTGLSLRTVMNGKRNCKIEQGNHFVCE